MKTIFLTVVALAAASLSFPLAAQVNRCVINGQAVYQAAPCPTGSSAKVLPNRDTARPADGGADYRSRLLSSAATLDATKRIKEIDKEIAGLKDEIDGYQAATDNEIAALKAKQATSRNNLAGATWEQALAAEMQVVVSKYQTKIGLAKDRIAALEKEKAALKSAKP